MVPGVLLAGALAGFGHAWASQPPASACRCSSAALCTHVWRSHRSPLPFALARRLASPGAGSLSSMDSEGGGTASKDGGTASEGGGTDSKGSGTASEGSGSAGEEGAASGPDGEEALLGQLAPGALLVGFTATPKRHDKTAMSSVFQVRAASVVVCVSVRRRRLCGGTTKRQWRALFQADARL